MKLDTLATACGLTFDDDGTGRLFFDEDRIDVFCDLLTAAEFKRMEREINAATAEGPGYRVYAWNDSSGYRYWHRQGKVGDSNYIQVTVDICDVSKVDPARLKRDVDSVYGRLCHWRNVEEWHCKRLDQLERRRK